MSDLPRAQVRITEDFDRDRKQIAEVWVNGEAVGQLMLSSWGYEGSSQGPPKLRLDLIANGAAIDSYEPEARKTESVSVRISGDVSTFKSRVAKAQAALDTYTRGTALAARINALEDDGPNHFRGERE